MNVGLPSENLTFYHAAPPSDSARGPVEISGLSTAVSPLAATEPPVFPNAPVQVCSVYEYLLKLIVNVTSVDLFNA